MAPAWAPTLTQVAEHVLSKTRDLTTNEPAGTFTTTTAPTGDQVTGLIDQACTLVTTRTGTPIATDVDVQAACRVAAALWAACWVERSHPERDADITVSEQLRTDAEAMTAAAVALNTAAGGGAVVDPPDGGEGGASTALPLYSFPEPPAWADTSAYW